MKLPTEFPEEPPEEPERVGDGAGRVPPHAGSLPPYAPTAEGIMPRPAAAWRAARRDLRQVPRGGPPLSLGR